jgi:beta-lactamase regulating signal transducer with metallopeptidase domain
MGGDVNRLAEGVLGYLLSAGVRGGVLLALVAVATLALGRRSAGVRHLLWAAGLAGLAVISGLSWLLPAWRVSALPPPTLSVVGLLGGGAGGGGVTPVPVGALEAQAAAPPVAGTAAAATAASSWLPAVLLALWAAVALWLLARLLLGLLAAARLVRRSRPACDPAWLALAAEASGAAGLRRPVPLRLSDGVDSPVTAGLVRPVVLLPAAAAGWDHERLRVVLAHELGHVRRGDCLTQLLARALAAVHWWNPLVWLAERRMVIEREQACDDHVLAGGARPSAYARHLLAIGQLVAGGVAGRRAATVPGACIVGCSRLAGRIETLLDARRSHRLPGRRLVAGALAAGLLLALPAACLTGDALGTGGATRLVYRTDPGKRDQTAEVLARRLDELDLTGARVTRWGNDQLVVELPARARAGEAAVRAALEREAALSLALVDNDHPYSRQLATHLHGDAGAARLGIRVNEDRWKVEPKGPSYTEVFLEGPRAALAGYLAALPASLQPPVGHALVLDAVETDGGAEPRARTVLVDRGRGVSPRRLADATALPGHADGWYELQVKLAPEDAARMLALTTGNVGRRVLIEIDGREVWGTPVIQAPFSDRVRLTARGAIAEGQRLAASFRAGSLPAPLELVAHDERAP